MDDLEIKTPTSEFRTSKLPELGKAVKLTPSFDGFQIMNLHVGFHSSSLLIRGKKGSWFCSLLLASSQQLFSCFLAVILGKLLQYHRRCIFQIVASNSRFFFCIQFWSKHNGCQTFQFLHLPGGTKHLHQIISYFRSKLVVFLIQPS